MNPRIKHFSQKELSPHDNALLKEWIGLDELYNKRRAENPQMPSITYRIGRKNVLGLPIAYEITYRCKSIIGVTKGEAPHEPIYGYEHKMRIILPRAYPSADGNPEFKFVTDIWHPNIRYSGRFKGRVCLTMKEMGVLASLKTLVLRVEEYLKWKLYHAQNTYPYPEDLEVALWVREEAEPRGWTHFAQNAEKQDFLTEVVYEPQQEINIAAQNQNPLKFST